MSTDRDEQGASGDEFAVAPPISHASGEGATSSGPASDSAPEVLEQHPQVKATADSASLETLEASRAEPAQTSGDASASAAGEAASSAAVNAEELSAQDSSAEPLFQEADGELAQAASGFEARAEESGARAVAAAEEDALIHSAEESAGAPELSAADSAPRSVDEADSLEPSAEALLPILEAVLFASPTPLSVGQIQSIFSDGLSAARAREALQFLADRCDRDGRGIVLCEIAGGWQFLTREEYFPFVQRVARVKHDDRLTPAGIETLAVVAYRQPISRAEVDAIRGVGSAPLIRTLMDRGLVRVTGRASTPGNPFQYGTTPKFLRHFGLKSEKDLPDPRDLQRLLAEREASHGP